MVLLYYVQCTCAFASVVTNYLPIGATIGRTGVQVNACVTCHSSIKLAYKFIGNSIVKLTRTRIIIIVMDSFDRRIFGFKQGKVPFRLEMGKVELKHENFP